MQLVIDIQPRENETRPDYVDSNFQHRAYANRSDRDRAIKQLRRHGHKVLQTYLDVQGPAIQLIYRNKTKG